MSAIAAVSAMVSSVADPRGHALAKQQFITVKIVPLRRDPLVQPHWNPATPMNGCSETLPEPYFRSSEPITVAGITNSAPLECRLCNDLALIQILTTGKSIILKIQRGTRLAPLLPRAPAYRKKSTLLMLTGPQSPLPPEPHCLATYVSAAGLTGPFAGIYFTVEVGTATVAVESTSAVNTAALSSASGVSYADTGSSPSSTMQPKSSTMKVDRDAVGGSIMDLLGMTALLCVKGMSFRALFLKYRPPSVASAIVHCCADHPW
ncbi:hypothetical protein DL93DRAFT_2230413 [Clavulina sp. PMI_390]|nr:hypothetical protein DL93DRAFT_2230413 [Clavulina sp. PMI_390]